MTAVTVCVERKSTSEALAQMQVRRKLLADGKFGEVEQLIHQTHSRGIPGKFTRHP
jgi:hypothetical protein